MNKFLMLAALFASTSAAMAQGSAWKASQHRGLTLYELSQGNVKASLVCDTNNNWEPPTYLLQVQTSGAILPGNTVTVSADGETVTVPLTGGSILGNDHKNWNKIVAMLAAPGAVKFTAGDARVQLDHGAKSKFNCFQPTE